MLHCFRALGVNIALDVLSGAVHVLDDMAFEALTLSLIHIFCARPLPGRAPSGWRTSPSPATAPSAGALRWCWRMKANAPPRRCCCRAGSGLTPPSLALPAGKRRKMKRRSSACSIRWSFPEWRWMHEDKQRERMGRFHRQVRGL